MFRHIILYSIIGTSVLLSACSITTDSPGWHFSNDPRADVLFDLKMPPMGLQSGVAASSGTLSLHYEGKEGMLSGHTAEIVSSKTVSSLDPKTSGSLVITRYEHKVKLGKDVDKAESGWKSIAYIIFGLFLGPFLGAN